MGNPLSLRDAALEASPVYLVAKQAETILGSLSK